VRTGSRPAPHPNTGGSRRIDDADAIGSAPGERNVDLQSRQQPRSSRDLPPRGSARTELEPGARDVELSGPMPALRPTRAGVLTPRPGGGSRSRQVVGLAADLPRRSISLSLNTAAKPSPRFSGGGGARLRLARRSAPSAPLSLLLGTRSSREPLVPRLAPPSRSACAGPLCFSPSPPPRVVVSPGRWAPLLGGHAPRCR